MSLIPLDPIIIPALTLPIDGTIGALAPELDPILIPALTLPLGPGGLAIPPDPIPIPGARGWALLWHEGAAVRAKTVAADGRLGAPIDLSEGRIVATLPQSDARTHAIVLQPDGQLTDFILSFGVPQAPEPVDAPAIIDVNDIEIVQDPSHADVRLHQLPNVSLLTWWASPRELRAVELGVDGPVYPIRSFESRGNTSYQTVLLKRALDSFSAK